MQLADFLGQSANAVKWQRWMALLVYVLRRFQARRMNRAHSFVRRLTLRRAALWQVRDVSALLTRYGTAGGDFRDLHSPRQAQFPGFVSHRMGQHT